MSIHPRGQSTFSRQIRHDTAIEVPYYQLAAFPALVKNAGVTPGRLRTFREKIYLFFRIESGVRAPDPVATPN